MKNENKMSQAEQNVAAAENVVAKADVVRRRDFVRKLGSAAIVGAASPVLLNARMAHAAFAPEKSAESAVGDFYKSLSEKQRKAICLPFDHKLRSKINPNWHVSKYVVGDEFYSSKQRAMIDQIVRRVSSAEGYERLLKQMEEDDGGMESYSVAIFGEPGSKNFQWEMTGRHLTLRADGNRDDQVAFGGPLVYGHGEEVPGLNLFHYQTQKANEIFAALDPKQRKQALLKKIPKESAVRVQGESGSFAGISVKELSEDQKELVERTLKTVLAPYRQADNDEVKQILKSNGGLDALHFAFYSQQDLENDGVWDDWRIEGPAFVCHFRGAPHVHAYINVHVKEA